MHLSIEDLNYNNPIFYIPEKIANMFFQDGNLCIHLLKDEGPNNVTEETYENAIAHKYDTFRVRHRQYRYFIE